MEREIGGSSHIQRSELPGVINQQLKEIKYHISKASKLFKHQEEVTRLSEE